MVGCLGEEYDLKNVQTLFAQYYAFIRRSDGSKMYKVQTDEMGSWTLQLHRSLIISALPLLCWVQMTVNCYGKTPWLELGTSSFQYVGIILPGNHRDALAGLVITAEVKRKRQAAITVAVGGDDTGRPVRWWLKVLCVDTVHHKFLTHRGNRNFSESTKSVNIAHTDQTRELRGMRRDRTCIARQE